QAHTTFSADTISTLYPAVLVQQGICDSRIKLGARGVRFISGMIRWAMVRAQWHGLSTTSRIYQGLVINRHCHSLTHFGMLAKNGVVEVKVHRLEVGCIEVLRESIVRQMLIGDRLGYIQEPS